MGKHNWRPDEIPPAGMTPERWKEIVDMVAGWSNELDCLTTEKNAARWLSILKEHVANE